MQHSPDSIDHNSAAPHDIAALVLTALYDIFGVIYDHPLVHHGGVRISDTHYARKTRLVKDNHSPTHVDTFFILEGDFNESHNNPRPHHPILFEAWLRWDAPHPIFGSRDQDVINTYWVVESFEEGEWIGSLSELGNNIRQARK